MKPRITPHEPTEAEIQHAAYFLWEAQGKPSGRDREIWFAAREQLKHRLFVRPSIAAARPVTIDARRRLVVPAGR